MEEKVCFFFTHLERLADVVNYVRDCSKRRVVAVEQTLEAEHDVVVPTLGGVEQVRRRVPRIVARLVSVEGLEDGILGAVALHAPQDQGSTRPRWWCARTRVRFDEDLIGERGNTLRVRLCGRKPDSSYVSRCSTHHVFTNVGGFAVGEILVDYGLEIASEALSFALWDDKSDIEKYMLLTQRTCAKTWTTSERWASCKARWARGEVRLVPVALRH